MQTEQFEITLPLVGRRDGAGGACGTDGVGPRRVHEFFGAEPEGAGDAEATPVVGRLRAGCATHEARQVAGVVPTLSGRAAICH